METNDRVMKIAERMNRRRFFGTAAMTVAAAQLGMIGYANAQTGETKRSCPQSSLGRIRRSVR